MSALHNNSNNDYLPELSKSSVIIDYEHYKIDGDNELTLVEYLNEISLPISNLINKKKKEIYNFKIQLSNGINFISVQGIDEVCIFYERSDAKKTKKKKIVMLLNQQIISLILFLIIITKCYQISLSL